MNTSRRLFLHRATALAAATGAGAHQLQLGLQLGGLSSLAALAASAHAADTSGYKALVCLYLHGGNDGHNWLVPTDATGYADYVRARGALALPASALQSITATTQGTGRTFAVPAELAPIRSLYESGQAAFVANVGPLLRPITKADYLAGRGVPPRLFSHNDQQSTWQSLAPEGARSGWGGRMGDVFAAANANPVFTAVSATGNAVFLTGTGVVQYQVNSDGPVGVNPLNRTWLLGSATAPGALRTLLADAGSNPFQNEYTRLTQRALQAEATLRSALTGVSVPALPTAPLSLPTGPTTLDQDALARQLRMVARLAAAQQALGMRRQVFMVSLGGFDTHHHQLSDQAALATRIANSVRWFHDTLTALGLAESVTLFTASDFGRTLASNGDGSDHGWGNHHLVVGPALRGREVHGRMPLTAIGTADEVGSGRLLPSTSVSQFAASLGRWMGLSEADLGWVLPDLSLFATAPAKTV